MHCHVTEVVIWICLFSRTVGRRFDNNQIMLSDGVFIDGTVHLFRIPLKILQYSLISDPRLSTRLDTDGGISSFLISSRSSSSSNICRV